MKILMVSRIDDRDALSFSASLGDRLAAGGYEVFYEERTADAMGRPGISLDQAGPDLVAIVGGDGTILFTVQRMTRQIPVIGINWGEVGFLADLEQDEAFDVLMAIADGFSVEKRMRLSFSTGNRELGEALNEVLIVTSRPAKMLRFGIVIDGILSEEFRGDGILISTPTGSTAYSMSAGGPIVDPKVEGVVLVPLAPYMLSSRPHLISTDRSLEIRIGSAKPATLVIDGQKTIDLPAESSIRVMKSRDPALFVDIGRHFFEKVDKKLRRL
ncbi:MAG: NAD(+) kinase [Methanoregulaceae archaeon]|jgi:NAD+ kinase|nr:NAD(+) kinase [Methanoregulaceae archaeon]